MPNNDDDNKILDAETIDMIIKALTPEELALVHENYASRQHKEKRGLIHIMDID